MPQAESTVTREIYWNIAIPEPWRTLLMLVLGMIPVIMVARSLRGRWMEWKSIGGLDDPPPRSEWRERALRVLRHAIGQERVKRRKAGGWGHTAFFYSFIALFIGTVIVAFQHDFAKPVLGWYFFKDTFYRIFSATLEVAGVIAILAVALALHRRLVAKPQHLGGSIDWVPSLWWFQAVLVTGFMVEAARIAGTGFPEHERTASFVGYAIAGIIPGGPELAARIHFVLWWGHLAISLWFLGLFSAVAMGHIFTVSASVFLARDIPSGATPRPIQNIEEAERFGVLTIDQFMGPHLRDVTSCVECGRCTEVCPANITGKPLSPKKLVNDLRDMARARLPKAEGAELPEIVGTGEGQLTPDEIWSCTTCGACERECPAMIEVVEKVVELRRGLVLMKSEFPPEVQNAFTNLEQQGNPWGKPADDRDKWARDMEDVRVPVVGEPEAEGAEYLFWVGCAGSYDARGQRISRALVRLLTRANVKFAILGPRETCTGDPAMRIGNEYLYQMLAKQNIETLKEQPIRKIVASCPHCLQTIGKDYPNLGGKFEVVHHSELLARLVAEGRLAPSPVAEHQNAVLHDSCYLARHNNIVDQPRAVANSVLGGNEVAEVPRCKDKGLCCGAGGGRMWMEEHLGHKTINTERAEELLSTGRDTIVTSCPFCQTMVADGAKKAAPGKQVTVMDIAELMEKGVK